MFVHVLKKNIHRKVPHIHVCQSHVLSSNHKFHGHHVQPSSQSNRVGYGQQNKGRNLKTLLSWVLQVECHGSSQLYGAGS